MCQFLKTELYRYICFLSYAQGQGVVQDSGSARLMTTLDLAKEYWQIPLDTLSRGKTAFATPDGLNEFEVMPFGLITRLANLQW